MYASSESGLCAQTISVTEVGAIGEQNHHYSRRHESFSETELVGIAWQPLLGLKCLELGPECHQGLLELNQSLVGASEISLASLLFELERRFECAAGAERGHRSLQAVGVVLQGASVARRHCVLDLLERRWIVVEKQLDYFLQQLDIAADAAECE